jgi:hypothetical protein
VFVVEEDLLRASHLRVKERLEKAYPANKNSEGLQRHLGPAHETSGVRGGLSSRAVFPIRTIVRVQLIPGWSKIQMRNAKRKAEG